MRTLVLGDIHGAYKALRQCFERSSFDPDNDRLIFIGDAVDGWSGSPDCVEALRRVANLIYILGNHDVWLLDWFLYEETPELWLSQGGRATIDAYSRRPWVEKKARHLEFLLTGRLYFVDEDHRLFVHAGLKPGVSLESQQPDLLMWDREIFHVRGGVKGYSEVFIGHSPTLNEETTEPLNFGGKDNLWRIDTGAGYWGPLTIIDVVTKQFWQSDPVQDLYPGETART